jgi:hypothetical protein
VNSGQPEKFCTSLPCFEINPHFRSQENTTVSPIYPAMHLVPRPAGRIANGNIWRAADMSAFAAVPEFWARSCPSQGDCSDQSGNHLNLMCFSSVLVGICPFLAHFNCSSPLLSICICVKESGYSLDTSLVNEHLPYPTKLFQLLPNTKEQPQSRLL